LELIFIINNLVLSSQPLVPLLCDGQLQSSSLGQADVGLGALAYDEGVTEAGGERVTVGILDVAYVKGAGMTLSVHDGADATRVAASSDHAEVAGLELDVVHDLAGVDVKADRIVDLKEESYTS
jgi:hypothetical protein